MSFITSQNPRTRFEHLPDWANACPDWLDRIYSYQNSSAKEPKSYSDLRGHPVKDHVGAFPRGQHFTVDEVHPRWRDRNLLDSTELTDDIGGEFYSVRRSVTSPNETFHFDSGKFTTVDNLTYREHYWGPSFVKDPFSVSHLPDPVLTDLGPVGTRAVSLCKPTNNVANLAVDLAEAKSEGLPALSGASLWKGKTRSAKDAGGEYLNYQFGWLPLVSDIKDSCYAAANAHKIIESYRRNSHKLVRRRMSFPTEVTESSVVEATGSLAQEFSFVPNTVGHPFIDRGVQGAALRIRTDRTVKRTWFSGAFTYHLPLGFDSHNVVVDAAAKAGPLLGIELTPEVVWNATPWTWALNWVSNVGECVGIFSDMAVDGLVMHHGYVMEHIVTTSTWEWYNPNGSGGRFKCDHPYTPSSITACVETKRRRRASPFGFEIAWNGLSLRQLAIAGALGISRFP
jgi:hypothetical protein